MGRLSTRSLHSFYISDITLPYIFDVITHQNQKDQGGYATQRVWPWQVKWGRGLNFKNQVCRRASFTKIRHRMSRSSISHSMLIFRLCCFHNVLNVNLVKLELISWNRVLIKARRLMVTVSLQWGLQIYLISFVCFKVGVYCLLFLFFDISLTAISILSR